MTINKKLLWSLTLTSLVGQWAVSEEAPAHYQFKPGDSFFFTQKVKSAGKAEETRFPRLQAWGLNNFGGMIFAVARDPNDKTPGTRITQTLYGLKPDGCVVDVINGLALASGDDCKQPLATGQRWTVVHHKSTYECTLMNPATERVSVPAGEFDTTKIECRSGDPSKGLYVDSYYWYVPTLGAMVKATHRGSDSAGTELFTLSEELDRYQASSQIP